MVVKDRLNHIVDKSFPELLSFNFSLKYDELNDSFAETRETSKTSYTFILDSLFKTADEEIACMHAHITQDNGQSKFERWIDSFLCEPFPRYSLLDERNADLTVILRGYGLNLLKLLRFIDKKYPEYITEGLSINELEIILNLI
jgi:hypothetical protein